VARVIVMMRRCLDQALSLEQLAAIGLMSPYHFDRVFRRIAGLPPRRFLSALRLEAAKRLLVTTRLTVSEICGKVGYASLYSFSQRFTAAVGVSPRQLRSLAEDETGALRESIRGSLRPTPAASAAAGDQEVRGRVHVSPGPPRLAGPVFVGLFQSSIPQGRPAACTILEGPGEFQIRGAPEGRYHLFAAACDGSVDDRRLLLDDHALLGGLEDSVVVRSGRAAGPVSLTLAPATPFTPPMLVSIPALLHRGMKRARPLARRDGDAMLEPSP
jgi:AraC-like DNA-binding protein